MTWTVPYGRISSSVAGEDVAEQSIASARLRVSKNDRCCTCNSLKPRTHLNTLTNNKVYIQMRMRNNSMGC